MLHVSHSPFIKKRINENLTYSEIYGSVEKVWSVLYLTGYLTTTKSGCIDGEYELRIPNEEVKGEFIDRVREWMNAYNRDYQDLILRFCSSILYGKNEEAGEILQSVLYDTIGVFDAKYKESFYHGLLLGLLRPGRWKILTNNDAGLGFDDIILEPVGSDSGILIEIKYAKKEADLENRAREAIRQADRKEYAALLRKDGRKCTLTYGVSFYLKKAKILVEKKG